MDDALRCVLEQGEIGEGKLNVGSDPRPSGRERAIPPATRSRSPKWPWRASMNCSATNRRYGNERPATSRLRSERIPPRSASAGGPALLRRKGAAGRTRNAQLRAIPAGVGGARMPGAARAPHSAPVAGVQAAIGKDPGQLRPEAPAGESGPPGEDACWTARFWTAAKTCSLSGILGAARRICFRSGAGTDPARTPGRLHHMHPPGAGSAAWPRRIYG